MTPSNGSTKVACQKTFFDLDSFSDVTLKKFFDFSPVTSVAEATARLGNDSARLLEIINGGLIGEQRLVEYAKPDGWNVLNTETNELEGSFTGTPADQKAVNALVLTLAKTVFGYNKDLTKDQRDAARDAAMNMIKTTPQIKEGLKKSAALKAEDDGAQAA